jgi:hypothetical protein
VRSFDPVRLGNFEAEAWVAYYQRRWGTFLRASLGLVREGFGLPWPATLRGAWYVLRANQAWAPYPDNDPNRARTYMRRFYALVTRYHGETFDLDEAARLEVDWWRVHRELQREAHGSETHGSETQAGEAQGGGTQGGLDDLTAALASLYAHVYGVPADRVRAAAAHRAEAMTISDAWVEAGADGTSPAIAAERDELVKGYALLRAAVRSTHSDQAGDAAEL